MNIKTLNDQLIYVPNRLPGQSEFLGTPLASKKVLTLLGFEGVEVITKKFKELLKYRKEVFGDGFIGYYGMHSEQRFFDLKNRVVIDVKELITDPDLISKYDRSDISHPDSYPKRDFSLEINEVISPNWKKGSMISTYEMLKSGRTELTMS